jgi:RNA polymerase sigma-70 factor (ECF subfamily)
VTVQVQLPKSGSRDDLVQETYLRALQSLPSYEARAPFRVWLLGIARRTCADALRRRSRRGRLLARLQSARVEVVPAPAGTVAGHDLLRRLEPDRRAAFVLAQMLGLPYAEAVDVCAVPVGTIRSRVARARDDLQATTGRRLA